jgi:hypothetical protein
MQYTDSREGMLDGQPGWVVDGDSKMTFTDAAREVLRQTGRPLHYKEITEIAIEKNLLSHVGKSPEVTMGARLAATLKKSGDDSPLVRVKPGVFALSDWDEETIKSGLSIKRAPSKKKAKDDKDKGKEKDKGKSKAKSKANGKGDGDDEGAKDDEDDDKLVSTKTDVPLDDVPTSDDEKKRAQIKANADTVFDEEDDDDQPILKAAEEETQEQSEEKEEKGGRRRRRRRRRRGSRSSSSDKDDGGNKSGNLPSYTATPVNGGGMPRGPQVIELAQGDVPSLDGLAGRDLADAVAIILGTFDRTVGAVSLRQITETAQRKGKLSGDVQLAQSQISAAVRADNGRRAAAGYRPRFRLAGGRVGLTDWLLDGELARAERELLQSLNRYRDAARKAFMRKASELPGYAYVELCATVLEKVGVTKIQQVKFPGASGAEVHLAGVLYTPTGILPSAVAAGEGLPLAIVIRKDGRDLGRERVTELRGAAHHYNHAKMGWIFSTGQVLSGAREECQSDGVLPVSLIDAAALAQLCDEHGIGVIRATFPVGIPDVDLFEGLRSS